jgi:hypothetical protein
MDAHNYSDDEIERLILEAVDSSMPHPTIRRTTIELLQELFGRLSELREERHAEPF